jgi:hypothetical protein
MRFAPNKYHLTHFTRKRRVDLTAPVQIAGAIVEPEPTLRILGVTLDKRLSWESHIKEVSQKMGPQLQALLRTTASTWGATLPKARQIYTAVIRSSIAYAAPVWHKPPKHATKARGPALKLQAYQNQSLRIITGAYKATPIRQLETEAFIPPLDLWLNGRLAQFQARLERTGMAQLIRDACETIKARIRNRRPQGRRPPPSPTSPGQLRKAWVEKWIGGPIDRWNEQEKPRILQDWKERWEAHNRRVGRNDGRELARSNLVPCDTPPTSRVLGLHKQLRKAESSLLVQARTGKIGLASFLFDRKVPGLASGQCSCGNGLETPRHIALFCTREEERRHLLRAGGAPVDYQSLVGSPQGAMLFTRWMICSGRLGQYSLARSLLYD